MPLLLCQFLGADFADDRYLDLSGIFEFLLDFLRDIMRKQLRAFIVDIFGFDQDAHLAARLDGVRRGHAAERGRELFEFLKAFKVMLDGFAPCARPCRGDGVGRRNDEGFGALRFCDAFVMREDGIDHLRRFVVFLRDIRRYLVMRAFDLVVDGFADIVQQRGAFAERDVEPEFAGDSARKPGDFQRMLQLVLSVGSAVFQFAEKSAVFRGSARGRPLQARPVRRSL